MRTPVGRYGGSLSHLRTDDLLGQTMVAACERVSVPLERIEDISAGCVNVAHEGMGDIARWGALAAGFPDSVPAVTVNRFCASSLTGAISIAHAIRCGELEVGLAAGVESMSRSGWANMKGDAPFSPRGPVFLLDTMWAGAGGPPNPVLLARNAYVEMIKTAQNVADRYHLGREEIDAFALRSHQHAAAARDSGRLAAEIHPIEIPGTRKEPGRTFEHDEMIRSDTTAERLAALAPQPNTTQMTAGNSSPLSDGASAVVLGSAEAAQSLGVTPLARVVASATYALDPQFMGIAPAFAIATALERAHLAPTEVDVWEVHEAFAAQALGVLRELPNQLDGFVVPDDRLNPNGGAVAIGHPFGSSGTRYVLTLATELQVRQVRYGVLGVCVGSGQGVALVLENRRARPDGRPAPGPGAPRIAGSDPRGSEERDRYRSARRVEQRLDGVARDEASSGSWWSIRPATPAPSYRRWSWRPSDTGSGAPACSARSVNMARIQARNRSAACSTSPCEGASVVAARKAHPLKSAPLVQLRLGVEDGQDLPARVVDLLHGLGEPAGRARRGARPDRRPPTLPCCRRGCRARPWPPRRAR